MNRGGVETWLLNVMRRLSRDHVAIDLMVHTDERAAYDDEVVALGATIHRNPHTKELGRYGLRLRHVLSGSRPYDVVHSHVHHFSGMVLAAAMLWRVPVRIAHSHNDTGVVDRNRSRWRRASETPKQLIRRCATDGFACSDEAGRAPFGDRWEDGRWHRLYYGIDTTLYARHSDRDRVRAELALPADASVMIHVGRFDVQKNHSFLIDVLAATVRQRENVFLVMVGSGLLEQSVAERAEALGVQDHVRFCGSRADVARLLGAADAFVFPSVYEGLPLACLEAQAAGLPVIMSDTITPEVMVVADRSRVPSVTAAWARAVGGLTVPPRRATPRRRWGGSPFDIAVIARTCWNPMARRLARRRSPRTGGVSRNMFRWAHAPVSETRQRQFAAAWRGAGQPFFPSPYSHDRAQFLAQRVHRRRRLMARQADTRASDPCQGRMPLQVVSSLAAGGVETRSPRSRHIDRTRFRIDYLVTHRAGRTTPTS
jgi:glycosyltransferase involved in cell wall biosynthesis